MRGIHLNTKVEQLTRVGKTIAKRLQKLHITTARDLLFYFPIRHIDFSKISPLSAIEPYKPVTVRGVIEIIQNRRSIKSRKIVTEAIVTDESGSVKVVWFNQPYLTKILHRGESIFLAGEPEVNFQELHFVNPLYERAGRETIHTGRIIPVYSLTKNITQKQIRFLVKQVIHLADQIEDWIPEALLSRYYLPSLGWSLRQIHFPDNFEWLSKAIERLKYDEFLVEQIKIAFGKKELSQQRSPSIEFQKEAIQRFVASLPFSLTRDQKIASWQIIQDMQKTHPMNRLLEGEVGSGKTLVAAIALLNTALNKAQTVFMAPTEVLAIQHYEKLSTLMKPFALTLCLLTRTKKILNSREISKKVLKKKIAEGEVLIVIGTHALLSEDVIFQNLALAVIDEQHRFGVEQRRQLTEKSRQKNLTPHFLSMTATPIPRSLALILYGDLDVSIIREMPKGRKKVITKIVLPQDREKAYCFVKEKIAEGQQAYIICPLIDPSERMNIRAVTDEYRRLQKEIFPHIPLGLLHGKMKTKEKEEVIAAFRRNVIKILVATSVIEVGVDVPNATMMIIEDAERFGLAQLYQFRGRVGRSHIQSYCFLFSGNTSEKTQKRLRAFLESKDSFDLAQRDLELRGPGEIYGRDQSGFPEFKIARLTDVDIMKKAKAASEEISAMSLERYPSLKKKVEDLISHIHLE